MGDTARSRTRMRQIIPEQENSNQVQIIVSREVWKKLRSHSEEFVDRDSVSEIIERLLDDYQERNSKRYY